jgi:hypothetical protein
MHRRIALVLTAAAIGFALVAASSCGDDSSSGNGDQAARQELRQQLKRQEHRAQERLQRERAQLQKLKQQQHQQQQEAQAAPPPPTTTTTTTSEPAANCESGYDPCVPPYPPDLDCADVGGPITVSGSDPHGFDADGDGSGCE